MGVGTILAARRVILMAFGEGKAPVVAQAVEGPVTPAVAASFLQQHTDAQFMLDEAAAAELAPIQKPLAARAGGVGRRHRSARPSSGWPAGRQADPQAHRRGLQRARPAGPARRPRAGLRHQPRRLPLAAGDDHRLARRQAGLGQAARRHHPPARCHFPQARADLLAAPRRRRDHHGRHAHPPGRPGARSARRLPDQREHRRLRSRRAALRRLRRRLQPLFGIVAAGSTPAQGRGGSGTSRSSCATRSRARWTRRRCSRSRG